VRRRWSLLLVLAALVAVAAAVPLSRRGPTSHPAAKALGPLPSGFRYATIDPNDAGATAKLFRERHAAVDVAVALVGAPTDLAPLGVKVVAFTRRTAPVGRELTAELAADLPIADAVPRVLHGQTVLAHDGDETFSSSALWVHDRLAIVAYGSTTGEVEAVLGALIDRNR
jgi:hypothetical protein